MELDAISGTISKPTSSNPSSVTTPGLTPFPPPKIIPGEEICYIILKAAFHLENGSALHTAILTASMIKLVILLTSGSAPSGNVIALTPLLGVLVVVEPMNNIPPNKVLLPFAFEEHITGYPGRN